MTLKIIFSQYPIHPDSLPDGWMNVHDLAICVYRRDGTTGDVMTVPDLRYKARSDYIADYLEVRQQVNNARS